jgi:putative membrane protein
VKFITNIIVTTLSVIITAWLLPGVRVDSVMTAILVAIVLAFLNTVVKPILTILTIPITFFTLGFFLLVINAFMIILVTKLVDGFQVDGFWKALLFSLILSLTTSILNMFAGSSNKEED